MASLSGLERATLELLLGMKSGYVLDFSNSSFDDFVHGATGKHALSEIYGGESISKANRLRAFWQIEDDATVAALLSDLVEYAMLRNGRSESDPLIVKGKAIAKRLLGAPPLASPGNTLNVNDLTATTVVVGSQTIINNYGSNAGGMLTPEGIVSDDPRLLELLTTHFSFDELSLLAFELGIDADELDRSTKSMKAISLIRYCQRRDLTAQLKAAILRARPNIDPKD